MAGAIRGITVEIGGDTTKLGKALEGVNSKSKSLSSELRGINSLLKMDPGNADLLAQKQQVLTEAVAETTAKLEILKEAESQVQAQFESGEIGAEAYRDFQREIITTKNKLESLEDELNNTGDSTEDFGNTLEDAGDSAQSTNDGFTVMKGALADLVANVIQSAISAIGDLIGSLLELTEMTEEYRSMQGKLAGSAGTFGYSIDYASEKYKQFYSYLGDDQASTNAITNLMGLQASTETTSALAEGAIAVWSAYGDSIPIEALTESVTESSLCGKITGVLADTINWAANSQETFGNALDGNAAAQAAFNKAIADGLPVEDAASAALAEITDTQERADVIAQFLNDTYGESKETYDDLNGSIIEANESELALKDTQAKLGETVAPINNAMTDLKNQALIAITPLVEKLADGFMNLYNWMRDNPTVMTIVTAVVIALATAFGVLATALAIQGIITGVTKAIAFLNTTLLANPIVLIVAAIAGLVAAFIYLWNNCEAFRNFWIKLWADIQRIAAIVFEALKTFFTVTVPAAWGTFITWLSGFTSKIVSFFAELPGKIWAWLVNIVARIAAWGSNMWNTATTWVSNLISSVVNFFAQLPDKIWTWLVNVVTRIVTWGANIVNTARTAASNMINTVVLFAAQLPGRLYTAISGAVSRVVSWGASIASAAGTAIRNMGNRIVEIAKSIPSRFINIGRDIIEGIKTGIGNAVGGLYNFIVEKLKGLVEKGMEALGINSPSKVFAKMVGSAIPEGIAKGVDDNSYLADDSVTRLTDEISDQAVNLNGATLNRKLSATFTANATQANTPVLTELRKIYDRLDRMQIVLDSRVLVGETVDMYDRALADRQILSARGV